MSTRTAGADALRGKRLRMSPHRSRKIELLDMKYLLLCDIFLKCLVQFCFWNFVGHFFQKLSKKFPKRNFALV